MKKLHKTIKLSMWVNYTCKVSTIGEIMYPIVPVLMYHSVADHASDSVYGHLSIPVSVFKMMISYLHKHKYNSVTLEDLYKYLSAGRTLPPRPIVITFDDGYLDNWVNAFPILKSFGMRATIFAVPEFIDPTNNIRPTMDNVWQGKLQADELSYWGFLSWNEMKEMSNSGLVDIQSHSLTHTYYFQGSHIVDFHHPGDKYHWLAWNKYPDRKHLWPIEHQDHFIDYGLPIYTYGRALSAPQYFTDELLDEFLVKYIKNSGGKIFFKDPNWKNHLLNVTIDYKNNNRLKARFESHSEYKARVRKELVLSKEMIEGNIGKEVKFLCWPGGAFNPMTQRIAQEVGYLATTKGQVRNAWGADPQRINRIGVGVRLKRIHPLVDRYMALLLFVAQVESYRGNHVYAGSLYLTLKTLHFYRRLKRIVGTVVLSG